MAETIHSVLRMLHIFWGFLGLAAFWAPVFTKKGGKAHIRAGKVFTASAYVVALTALGSCCWALAHPSSFTGRAITWFEIPAEQVMFVAILGLLAIFLLQSVETGLRVLRARRQPERYAGQRLRSVNGLQALAGAAVLLFGAYHLIRGHGPMFCIPVGLGLLSLQDFRENRRFLADPRPTPMAWWYKHMECMLGAGIAFHTAFLVFGARSIFGESLIEGSWSFLPWILPTAVGLPAVHFWTRYYKKKFGELPAKSAEAAEMQS
ncbi:MAG: hypothetical protein OXL36_08070 [Bryobacterales bacterium]|nr:hypothetical protein [Bryobacterales bacterium]MDE0296056.1 hypothetical protein [Bryobacterales bacterium]